MTARNWKRLRKWDVRVEPAYRAGVMDGMDMAYIGEPRPQEIISDLDTTFYFRRYLRHAQEVSNAMIARNRGRVDGYDLAMAEMKKADDDDFIERQVEQGMAEITQFLLRQAA